MTYEKREEEYNITAPTDKRSPNEERFSENKECKVKRDEDTSYTRPANETRKEACSP